MKSVLKIFLFLVLTIGCSFSTFAQAPDTRGTTGIATLFAQDPITQSLCLKDGGPGHSFQDGQTRNRCSDVTFDSYSRNGFSIGMEGGREGVIIDLGTSSELKARYGYDETVGNGQGFASIDIRNGRAFILKNYKTGELQEIANSAELYKPSIDANESAPVKPGHVYLIRITDRHDKSVEVLAKMLVLAFTPSESVTVRWYVMANNTMAKR